jgi:type II secretory pathway component PulM
MRDVRAWWRSLTFAKRALVAGGAVTALVLLWWTLSRWAEVKAIDDIRADLPGLLARAEALGQKLGDMKGEGT